MNKKLVLLLILTAFGIAVLIFNSISSAHRMAAARGITQRGKAMEKATFGAGCFWGVEAAFRHLPGVIATRVGYAGGTAPNPSYEQVCAGRTGHTEVVEVSYDPAKVSYEKLLETFWNAQDPTEKHKAQYKSVIFYHTPAQQKAAVASKQAREQSGFYQQPIVTEMLPAPIFYEAEAYHQHYYEKMGIASCPAEHPLLLRLYDATKKKYVELPPVIKTEAEWQKQLTPEQFKILRQGGTELACSNAYWDNHAPGLYRCAACGNDLFVSEKKFESGTGWPSFWVPVAPENIKTVADKSLGMVRTEVRCARCGSHLGHVFEDGPKPTGLRYCMNSGAMEFVPAEREVKSN
jgi:peptide methionine sulfoxide reductase msrA/msrB